ncbi:MAG TPA: acetyltransferase [Chryseolinea sp.]|nr:acetyltransferase [Chryseolinea sp.]
METTRFILIGGGQHARVVLDSLLTHGADVVAIFDDNQTGELFGIPMIGAYDPAYEPSAAAIIAVGDNATRKRIAATIRHKFSNTIHPSVVFSAFASLGKGNMILHGAIVQPQAKIGNHVIVNTGAQIDHDCIVDDFVHLSPRAVLCGRVHVGEGAFIGAGATLIPGVSIGAWAVVGAGAVVIDNIPDHAVVVGNPARLVKVNQP